MKPWFVITLLGCASTAQAQETPKAQSDSNAVTTSTRAPLPAFATERSQNTVDEAALRERQPTSLTTALQGEPGVVIQSTNRGAGTLILRGLVGPENLFIYDGVRFNQSTFRSGPNQYLDTIDPWGLQRIEVVRGPAGVLYGTGAMGGVVEAHPLPLPAQTEARGRFGFHSADDTASAAVDAGSRKGPAAARAGATLRQHGRLRVGSNRSRNARFASGVDGTEYLAHGYEDLHLRASAGAYVDEQLIRVNYVGAQVRDAMRLDALGRGDVRFYDNDDHLAYITAELAGPTGVDEVRANLSWHRTGEQVTRYSCDAPGGVVRDRFACADLDRSLISRERRNEDTVDTFGTSLIGTTRVLDEALHLSWGGDAYFDGVRSEAFAASSPEFVSEPRDRGNFADGSTYRTIGLLALARYDVIRSGEHTLRLHAGTRVENFGARADAVTNSIGDVRYDFTGLVGSAGAAWLVGTTLNAYLNWNQGFRAPNLQETTVLGDSGNFYEIPNPNLAPERSDTFELGAKLEWANVIELQSAVWTSLLSDRITREPASFEGAFEVDGKEVRQRVNRESAYFVGADLGARTRAVRGVSIFGSVSWIDGAIAVGEPDETFVEGPLHALFGGNRNFENPRRLPPVSAVLGTRYEPTKNTYFNIYLGGAAARRKLAPDDRSDLRICEVAVGRLADPQSCDGTRGWLTLNASAGLRYEMMRIDLAALNLTDERYRHHGSGVPAPGFDIAAQVTLEY